VRRLKVGDLNLAPPRSTLTIHGKGRFGGKYRTIPMDPMTRAVLEKWVADHRREVVDEQIGIRF
jgi:integrase